jgi:chromate transporter
MYKINVMQVALFDLFFSFFKLGLTAFGGPAMVAYIRELAVQKREWLTKEPSTKGLPLPR